MKNYQGALSISWSTGKSLSTSTPWTLIVALYTCVILYMVLAMVAVPSSQTPDYHFGSEGGMITAMSAILLSMTCAFSLISLLVTRGDAQKNPRFWLIMTAATGFLAVDELLMIHEYMGGMLNRVEVLANWTDRIPIRGWNDIIVILYGVAGMAMGLYFLPIVLRIPNFFKFLCLGSFFYIIHTLIDSLVEPPTVSSVILEESCKLLTATSLMSAFLVAALTNIDLTRAKS